MLSNLQHSIYKRFSLNITDFLMLDLKHNYVLFLYYFILKHIVLYIRPQFFIFRFTDFYSHV